MIEPLSSYYSLFNHKTGKSLKLDKQELLRKTLEINSAIRLVPDKKSLDYTDSDITNSLMEQAINNFFPEDGNWYSSCSDKPEDLNMEYLPCHLQDDLWLAKMLKKNQNLLYLSTDKILEFIKNSQLFQEKRHTYAQEVVRWQIDWMVTGGENWLTDTKYGGEFICFSPLCDIGFRKGIVDTLEAIGMADETIEEGIEKNASIWRERLMNRAFNNEFEPIYLSYNKDKLEKVNPEFRANWLKMRRYEYYQEHKDSVDKYGVVEPDMLLSKQEIDVLQEYLNEEQQKRKLEIKKYQEEGTTNELDVNNKVLKLKI